LSAENGCAFGMFSGFCDAISLRIRLVRIFPEIGSFLGTSFLLTLKFGSVFENVSWTLLRNRKFSLILAAELFGVDLS